MNRTALAEAMPAGWPARATRPLTKICGVTTPALAAAAAAAGADMIGVVHFARSPRHLPLAAAAAVAEAVRGGAMVVALLVDADDALVDAVVAAVRPDALQLHGSETPARIAALAARHRLPVAKAFGIAATADVVAAAACTVLPILDAKPPRDADRPGGHGAAFDWSLLDGFARPYMLSGGLTPETVAAAVARTRPYAVDVSSGVESGGLKDAGKVRAFIAAAREAPDPG